MNKILTHIKQNIMLKQVLKFIITFLLLGLTILFFLKYWSILKIAIIGTVLALSLPVAITEIIKAALRFTIGVKLIDTLTNMHAKILTNTLNHILQSFNLRAQINSNNTPMADKTDNQITIYNVKLDTVFHSNFATTIALIPELQFKCNIWQLFRSFIFSGFEYESLPSKIQEVNLRYPEFSIDTNNKTPFDYNLSNLRNQQQDINIISGTVNLDYFGTKGTFEQLNGYISVRSNNTSNMSNQLRIYLTLQLSHGLLIISNGKNDDRKDSLVRYNFSITRCRLDGLIKFFFGHDKAQFLNRNGDNIDTSSFLHEYGKCHLIDVQGSLYLKEDSNIDYKITTEEFLDRIKLHELKCLLLNKDGRIQEFTITKKNGKYIIAKTYLLS